MSAFKGQTRPDTPNIPDQLARFRDIAWWQVQGGADNNVQDGEFYCIGIQNGGNNGQRHCHMTKGGTFNEHIIDIATNAQLGDVLWALRVNSADRDVITIGAGLTGLFRSEFPDFEAGNPENADWNWQVTFFDANNFDTRDFGAGGRLLFD